MIIEEVYRIDKWSDWLDFVYDSGIDFWNCFEIYPNVILMNQHTFSQFNYILNIVPELKQMVFELNKDVMFSIDEYIEINHFLSDEFELTFAFSEDIADKEFVLLYDTNPNWNDDDQDDSDDNDDDIIPLFPDPVTHLEEVYY